jgi:hypothetical protein
LRRPVGRNVLAVHPPDFFGVAFEERVKQPFSELIAHPFFKIPRVPYRKQTRFQPGKNAQNRFENAQLKQRFNWLQWIGKKFAAVKNPR